MAQVSFTIVGGIPSKKNRHIIKKNRKTGAMYIGSDDAYHLWEVRHSDELSVEMKNIGNMRGYENLHIDYLFRISRNKDGSQSKKQWDISNKVESINDMMVKAGMIDDDCHRIITSFSAKVTHHEDIKENECVITLSHNFTPSVLSNEKQNTKRTRKISHEK